VDCVFPAYRQALPILVILTFVFAAALGSVPDGRRATAVALTVVALAGSFLLSHRDAENHRGKTERWEWACKQIAEEIAVRWGDHRPVIAVTAAGCLPYFSKLPALDMHGLNDAHLARNRPDDFGYGYMGHELMDPEYVVSRAPEIVIFHIGRNPSIPADFVRTDFLNEYERVSIDVPGWDGHPGYVWLRGGFP
jgi:arabinofuranosyltransferase